MRRSLRYTLILVAAFTLLPSCASIRTATPTAAIKEQRIDKVEQCAQLYANMDNAIERAGVRDSQDHRIPDFPYLRISRFDAAVRPPVADSGFASWLDRLQRLDQEARTLELANLKSTALVATWSAQFANCADILRRHDLTKPENIKYLSTVAVPDSYRPLFRAIGLYPLVSVPFLMGVNRLHRETTRTFETALAQLPVRGTLTRYQLNKTEEDLRPSDVAEILSQSSANPLSIPNPSSTELAQLFRSFAPIWEIDVATREDEPGYPQYDEHQQSIVRGEPRIYTLVSYTQWQGQTLLQLNYVIWFPSRPRKGVFDLTGGHMDGITWRITLAPDGTALFGDAMHNCGCYHSIFPSTLVGTVVQRKGWEEPISVPASLPPSGASLVLRVATDTHYLQNISPSLKIENTQVLQESYVLAEYDELRSMPINGERRASLFAPSGLIAGTNRRERWLFWPMGVGEPGAMRQWGHHAIAFVGKRHFDDPNLFERYFTNK